MKSIRLFLLIFMLLGTKSSFAQTSPDDKFERLGIKLPLTGNANQYVNMRRVGNIIYLSGKGPLKPDGSYIKGKLGVSLDVKQGAEAARLCAIHQLAILKAELGSLSKIKQVIKVTGFVNSSADFTEQPQVIDGFSQLLNDVLGESGKHARSAVGVNSLPFGWAVEVEMIVEVEAD
ncbi:MAG: hypothetical protein DI539_07175 [Flavobacterium psychrophilum]|nr:MAG: hypothetical protein DI539_07175 [Flavobacterium psychrophilum]